MKQWIGLLARLVTGGVWIVAGALKLPDPVESVRAVRAYDLLPESIVPTVGYALPVVEVVVGVCLVLGLMTRVCVFFHLFEKKIRIELVGVEKPVADIRFSLKDGIVARLG